MFISICAFSIMDLIVKWSDDYPVGQVLFFRGLFGIWDGANIFFNSKRTIS